MGEKTLERICPLVSLFGKMPFSKSETFWANNAPRKQMSCVKATSVFFLTRNEYPQHRRVSLPSFGNFPKRSIHLDVKQQKYPFHCTTQKKYPLWCNRWKRLTNTSWNTSSKVNFRVVKVASHGDFQMIWTSQYGDFAAKKSCATPVQLCCAMVPSLGKHQLPKHFSYKSKLPKNLLAIPEVH